MEWQEDILLQILLQRNFWVQDVGGQLYSRIFIFGCPSTIDIDQGVHFINDTIKHLIE
jgi:hypothetical protein